MWVQFLYLETALLEFWAFVLLRVRLNGRLGGDFNPGSNNEFKYTEKTKFMVNFLF